MLRWAGSGMLMEARASLPRLVLYLLTGALPGGGAAGGGAAAGTALGGCAVL